MKLFCKEKIEKNEEIVFLKKNEKEVGNFQKMEN